MLGFTPFKRHANKFNYIPRYYDPEKEAREQRRAELRGERAEEGDRPYRPGQYIRTQRDARAVRRAEEDDRGRKRIWTMAVAVVLVLLFVALLYPRLVGLFLGAADPAAAEAAAPEIPRRDALDQTGIDDVRWQEQPITVVPNDYQE